MERAHQHRAYPHRAYLHGAYAHGLYINGAYTNGARQQGVTLIELLVVMALIVMIANVGYPGMRALAERNARRAAVMQLQDALALTRNTAITRHAEVSLCPRAADKTAQATCGTDWSKPLLVVAGSTEAEIDPDHIQRVFPGIDARVTYNRGWKRVKYNMLGHSGGHNGTFTLCPADHRQPGGRGTELILSQLGRTRLEKTTCTAATDNT
ncbi:GspH/FimT family pseudopilin [Vreelandella jeotgali]|uniref:GspH/FimT family pseudopilin n=1 Tax=Vreelandella jeotgali TaxID=553386 RepID=UPI002480E710|nr:GspH/FimT family pseudopilin [Halomonas jeotgali]